MTKYLLSLVLFCSASPVFAQGPDDCPPGHDRHTAFTALDRPSMVAAITASFVGLNHRQPTGIPGSGSDDVGYWVQTADHYGLYGDDVCRAGWNLYRENQLGGLPTGPADGDRPARFRPGLAPVPTPISVPSPTPAPVFSDAALLAAVADVKAQLDELTRASGDAHAAINQNVTDGRAENRRFFKAVGDHWRSIAAVAGPIVTWYVTQRSVAR